MKKKDEDKIRFALRTLYGVEIVGDVAVYWWAYVGPSILNARAAGASCVSCKEQRPLTRCTVVANPNDSKGGAFVHLCTLCGDTPEAVDEARRIALEFMAHWGSDS